MQVWWTSSPSNLHILKKIKNLIGKSHQTYIYSKKSKVLIGKSHQTCIYSKKSKNFRLYVGLTGKDELVFDFFDFFEYMQVWWLLTILFFDFFEYMQVLCTFGIKMLIFLSICRFGDSWLSFFGFFQYMQVLCTFGIKMLIFLSICSFCALLVVKIIHF